MNTVRALERLAGAPHSAPELASALRVEVRSARRLLQRLQTEGYVVQDAGHRRRFRATLRLVSVSALLLRRATLPRVAAPELEALAVAAGATAQLWIAGEDQPVCIARVGGTPDALLTAYQPQAGGAGSGPVSTVLDRRRRAQRSSSYARDAQGATAAAAVLDRDTVVAALGLSGDLEPSAAARLATAAARIDAALAEAAAA